MNDTKSHILRAPLANSVAVAFPGRGLVSLSSFEPTRASHVHVIVAYVSQADRFSRRVVNPCGGKTKQIVCSSVETSGISEALS